jgi:hypothetical protein
VALTAATCEPRHDSVQHGCLVFVQAKLLCGCVCQSSK